MQMAYATVLVFMLVAAGFVLVSMAFGKLLRPDNPVGQKLEVYECGEAPITRAWFNFNPRFYVIALVFLIFDVEIAFLYPVAAVFKRWVVQGLGLFAFVEMMAFVTVLLFGLVYVWAKGDLEWVRSLRGGTSAGVPLTVARSRAGGPAAATPRAESGIAEAGE